MRFYRFPQAHSSLTLPNVGEVPFAKVSDQAAAVCVELSDLDIRDLKANRNRLFIIVPTIPPEFARPAHVVVSCKDIFAPTMKINGKDEKS